MPIFWKNKILLAKIEASYGTDPEPTAADNAILAVDIRLTPMEGQDVSRDLDLAYFGNQGTVPVELHTKIAFKVELSPSGTAGTAPPWGPLLRACAVAETIDAGTSVTYNPITEAQESIWIELFIGNTRFRLAGSRGTCVIRIDAQGIPYLEFEFTGLFAPAAEATRGAPALGAFQKPLVATTLNTPTFTLNAVPLVMRSFALNIGNTVEGRFLVGAEAIIITERDSQIETTVEAVPVSTFNPFQLAQAQTDVAIALTHGTAAGRIATLAVASAQMQRPQGLENAQNIAEWPLRLAARPVAGNDDWTLTLT